MLHCVESRTSPHFRTAAAALLAACLAGCATPYLHDASVQTQTTAVSDAWSKVDDSAYFTALRKSFADLETAEDGALTRSFEATRDRNLASYISPSEAPDPYRSEATRGVNALCEDVDERLSKLVGKAHRYAAPPSHRSYVCPRIAPSEALASWPTLLVDVTVEKEGIRAAETIRGTALDAFIKARADWRKAHARKADGAPKEPDLVLDCDTIAKTPGALAQARSVPGYPADQYKALIDACGGVTVALGAFAKGGHFDQRIDRTNGATASSIMADIFERQLKAREEAEKSSAAAQALQAELDKLEVEVKDSSTGWASQEFADALKDVKDTLAYAPDAAKLVKAQKLAQFLQDALKAEIANGGAKNASAEPPSVTTKRVQAIVELAAAGATFADAIRANEPGRSTNGLLITIAAERQQADMFTLDAERESDRQAILDAELLGALTEVGLLAEARLFLTRVPATNEGIAALRNRAAREAAEAALNRVALSWSEGRIPMNLARLRHVYLNRAYRVRIAEKTAENWRGLIKPAIDSMNAAGAGGIPPETIGNLLAPVGVAAVVGGK